MSVIIPAYNAAQYIGETIESVLSQTFTSYEIILVNDGSPDTEELERAIEPYRDRIVYIKQKNGGPAAARNTGIRLARGEFVAFLDSDDLYLPNYLQQQMAFIQSPPGYDLVYADGILFGNSLLAGRTFMQTAPSRGDVTFESLLAVQCTVFTSSVLARRQPIIEVGLFDEQHTHLVPAEDFDLWLRLARHGARMGYQRKVLVRHRKHSDSLSANSTRAFESALQVLKKAESRWQLTPSERKAMAATAARLRAAFELERGKDRLLRGDFQEAAVAIGKANKVYRRWKLRVALLLLRVAPHLLLRAYTLRERLVLGMHARV